MDEAEFRAEHRSALEMAEELRVLRARVTELEADLDDQANLGSERCCPEACNGGACETCRCCCAGWWTTAC